MMKLKTLAATAALSIALPALAAVTVQNNQQDAYAAVGQAELFLVVSDGKNNSYTFDTGFTFDQIATAVLAGSPLYSTISGSAWDAYKSADTDLLDGTRTSGTRFALGLFDGYGGPLDERHAIFTLNKTQAAPTLTNSAVDNIAPALSDTVVAANQTGSHPDTFVDDPDTGIAVRITNNNGASFNSALNGSASAIFLDANFSLGALNTYIGNAVGSTGVKFAGYSNSSTANNARANGITGLDAYSVAFTVDGAGNGQLAITAVPEPTSYALLLAGLAAIGFVARRRASR